MASNPIAGVPGAVRQTLAALLDVGRVRLQLASNEIEEARLRLLELLFYGLLASLFLVIGLVLAAITVAVVFWDSHRVLAMLAVTLFFLASALVLALRVRSRARAAPALLEVTLAELRRDADALRSAPQASRHPAA